MELPGAAPHGVEPVTVPVVEERPVRRWHIVVAGGQAGAPQPRGDVVAVDGSGVTLDAGAAAPSSDTAIHLAIYAAHPDAGAVLHAHPPYAIARTIAGTESHVEPANLEGRLFLGRVPVLEVEWEASAAPVAEALHDCPIVLVRGHGSYARGVGPWDALRVTSALEESAQILALAGR